MMIFFIQIGIISIAIFLLGRFLTGLLRLEFSDSYFTFFLVIVVGISAFVTIVALFFTRLNSVLLGVVLLSIVFYFLQKNEGTEPAEANFNIVKYRRLWFEWLLVFLVAFGIHYYSSNNLQSSFVNVPSIDLAYYARASFQLINKGVERSFYDPFYPAENFPDAYHYFDLWLNGGVSLFCPTGNLVNLIYITYPLGVSITWIGLCAIISLFGNITLADKVFAFFGTFIIGFISPLSHRISDFLTSISKFGLLLDAPQHYLTYNVWNATKLMPVYFFFILATLFFFHRKFLAAVFCLLLPCFFYSPTAPAITCCVFAFIVLNKFFLKKGNKLLLHVFVMTIFTIVFIVAFYWINQHLTVENNYDFISTGVHRVLLKIIRNSFDIIIQTTNVYLLWILPLVPFVSILIYKTNYSTLTKFFKEPYFLLVSLLILSGAACWAFFIGVSNAPQLYTNSSLIIINILIFTSYAFFLKSYSGNKVAQVILILPFLVLAFFSMKDTLTDLKEEKLYTDEFLHEVDILSGELSQASAFIFSTEQYKYHGGAPYVDILGQYLTLFRPDIVPVSLSIFNTPATSQIDSVKLARGFVDQPFHKFVTEQMKTGQFLSIEKSQINFIDKYKINHIIVLKGTPISNEIRKRVKKEIPDKASSQIILLLSDQ